MQKNAKFIVREDRTKFEKMLNELFLNGWSMEGSHCVTHSPAGMFYTAILSKPVEDEKFDCEIPKDLQLKVS